FGAGIEGHRDRGLDERSGIMQCKDSVRPPGPRGARPMRFSRRVGDGTLTPARPTARMIASSMKRRRAVERQLRLSYAPKISIGSVVRLYRADAAGIRDDDLLADVGWRLYERCKDILLISDAQVRCPECAAVFDVLWRDQPPGRMASVQGAAGASVPAS